MIAYDATARSSFDSLPRWIEQVKTHSEGVVKMVVATKTDMEGEEAVSEAEGRAFAAANGCLFGTTSSMLGEGVLPAFKLLASHVLDAQERREEAKETLWLSAPMPSDAPRPKKGCC